MHNVKDVFNHESDLAVGNSIYYPSYRPDFFTGLMKTQAMEFFLLLQQYQQSTCRMNIAPCSFEKTIPSIDLLIQTYL